MKKFNTPEINVVKFMNEDVITTSGSGGYGNQSDILVQSLGGFGVQVASDQSADIPF